MNIDERIEIIRKSLEGKFGQCSVNRGPIFAYFFVDKRPYLTLPKEFIEVLPLVESSPSMTNEVSEFLLRVRLNELDNDDQSLI